MIRRIRGFKDFYLQELCIDGKTVRRGDSRRKSIKHLGPERRKGALVILPGASGNEQGGKRTRPVVLAALQRMALGGKRSITADLIFWLLLYQDKSNSPRGN